MSQPHAAGEAALKLEIRPEQVAVVPFDQPGSRANTLGQPVLAEWEAILGQLEARKELRGLILRSGKPGMFIAGADLRELGSASSTAESSRAMMKRGHRIIGRIENLPYPTVALIDGACVGGGLEVAVGFDFRLAGSNPKCEVAFPEVKVGLIPGWGGTQRLTRIVGPSVAAEVICGGETVPARKALEMGIVFDVVPSEKLM